MWWWWGLLGYAIGEEQGRNEGRSEGLREAKRRIDGNDDGPPRIQRAQQPQPPPPPPTRLDWLRAAVLGGLIFGVAWMIEDSIFSPGGNYTIDDYPSSDPAMGFVKGIIGFFRITLFLGAFVPLALVANQYLDIQEDAPSGSFKFKTRGPE